MSTKKKAPNGRADRLWALLTAEVQEVQALSQQVQAKERRARELAEELR